MNTLKCFEYKYCIGLCSNECTGILVDEGKCYSVSRREVNTVSFILPHFPPFHFILCHSTIFYVGAQLSVIMVLLFIVSSQANIGSGLQSYISPNI